MPGAIGLFGHGWNPHYFVNPPAFTYLLHVVFAVWFGGREGVSRRLRHRSDRGLRRRARHGGRASGRSPSGCCTSPARGSSTAASACSPRRSWPSRSCRSSTRNSRSTTSRRSRRSRWRCGASRASCAAAGARLPVAGVGLGLACATKYTGGIVLLPLLGAAAVSVRARRAQRPGAGLALAGVVALAAFLAANPYAVLDFERFRDGLQHQSDAAGDAAGQARPRPGQRLRLLPVDVHLGAGLGAARRSPSRRLGLLARDDRRALAVLGPGARPVRGLHGLAGALLRALAAAASSRSPACWRPTRSCGSPSMAGARRAALRPALAALGAVVLLRPRDRLRRAQRARALARGHPQPRPRLARRRTSRRARTDRGRAGGARRLGAPTSGARRRSRPTATRWVKFPTSRSNVANDGSLHPGRRARREHRGLRAHAVPGPDRPLRARRLLLASSAARPSAAAPRPSPRRCPRAIAYYRELERRADLVYEAVALPRGRGAGRLQLRLVLRLLPAGLPPARAAMQVWRLKGGRVRAVYPR